MARSLLLALGLVLILLQCVAFTSATTYYVDFQNGNKSNSGLSPTEALRHVEEASLKARGAADIVLIGHASGAKDCHFKPGYTVHLRGQNAVIDCRHSNKALWSIDGSVENVIFKNVVFEVLSLDNLANTFKNVTWSDIKQQDGNDPTAFVAQSDISIVDSIFENISLYGHSLFKTQLDPYLESSANGYAVTISNTIFRNITGEWSEAHLLEFTKAAKNVVLINNTFTDVKIREDPIKIEPGSYQEAIVIRGNVFDNIATVTKNYEHTGLIVLSVKDATVDIVDNIVRNSLFSLVNNDVQRKYTFYGVIYLAATVARTEHIVIANNLFQNNTVLGNTFYSRGTGFITVKTLLVDKFEFVNNRFLSNSIRNFNELYGAIFAYTNDAYQLHRQVVTFANNTIDGLIDDGSPEVQHSIVQLRSGFNSSWVVENNLFVDIETAGGVVNFHEDSFSGETKVLVRSNVFQHLDLGVSSVFFSQNTNGYMPKDISGLITKSTFRNISTSTDGAAVSITDEITRRDNWKLSVDNNVFDSLLAPEGRGGALGFGACGRFSVSNNQFRLIKAEMGGAIYSASNLHVTHNNFSIVLSPNAGSVVLFESDKDTLSFVNNWLCQSGNASVAVKSFSPNTTVANNTFCNQSDALAEFSYTRAPSTLAQWASIAVGVVCAIAAAALVATVAYRVALSRWSANTVAAADAEVRESKTPLLA